MRKHRILVIYAVAVVLVIVAGVFGTRPSARAIRAWQARRHAQDAFAFIDKQNWSDASAHAVAAYQLSPTEPQALRAVARFLSRTRQPEALEFWKQLRERHLLTTDDRRDEALIAIMAADNERAEAAVGELLSVKNPGPADWILAAQLAFQKNLPEDAKGYLEKIVIDPRATERQLYQASVLQFALAGDNQAERASAIARLKKIGAGKTAAPLDSLVALAKMILSVPLSPTQPQPNQATPPESNVAEPSSPSTPRAPPITSSDEILDLARALHNHPLASAQHKLLALDLRLRVDPKQRDAIVSRAIDEWKNAAPAGLVWLGSWLNAKGEFQKTLDTIPLSTAMQSRDLFIQHLDALAGVDRWSDVKQLLSSEKFPLDPVLEQMYLARSSGQLGEKTAAANSWQRALEVAAGDPAKLMTVAGYAEKNGSAEIAEAGYDGVATISPKTRAAQEGRLRLAQASHDTKKLHSVLSDMLALWPNDAAIQNDEAYTRLLLLPADALETKQETVAIEQLAEKLIKREPASMPHRTLLALARLRQGHPEGALTVYSDLRVSQGALTNSALTVHAAVLAATAHDEDAKTEAAQIKQEQLLPEERTLIESLLDQG